jgi:DinB superfamily
VLSTKQYKMKTINSNEILQNLQDDVRQIIFQANQLVNLPTSLLEMQPAPEKWSVAQVLEHLNHYARFYIVNVENKLNHHQTKSVDCFSPSWLGNYFTRLMKPSSDATISKKMKSPKSALPTTQPDAASMISEFVSHQHHLLNLLHIAASANLNTIRIPTSLSKWITLKLGDTFRFFIAHEERHFVQIKNTLNAVKKIASVHALAS